MKFNLKQNKKGVSPIIATLLLIVIAVAAAVVTYAFVTGFIGTATGQSSQQGEMNIDSFTITNSTSVTVYVRDTGSRTETITSAYIDGGLATILPASTTISTNGTVGTIVVNSGTPINDGSSHQVKLVATDGTPVQISVVKTS